MGLRADRLVGMMFDSVADDAVFLELPKAIAIFVGSVSVQLQTHGVEGASTEAMYGLSQELLESYNAHYWQHDAWAIGYQACGLNQIATSESFVTDQVFGRSEIYNDLLRKNGDLFRCMGFVSKLGDSKRFLFGAHRAFNQPAFEPDILAKMQVLHELLTHLIEARHRALLGRGRIAERLLDDDPDPVFVVSKNAIVHYSNLAGVDVAAAGVPLRLVAGRLTTTNPPAATDFARAIAWACNGRGGSTIALSAGATPIRVAVDSLGDRDKHLACVRVLDEEAKIAATVSKAEKHFCLTPAETRLAGALLRGLSPIEHADRQGIGMPTVRTQMRGLLAKTGSARQAQMISTLRTLHL